MKRKRRHSSLILLDLAVEGGKKGFRERKFNFSLNFPTFGQSVLVGPRGKVALRYKGYAWTPVLWSFDNSGR